MVPVEVRGQFSGVSSLPPSVGPRGCTQFARPVGQAPPLLDVSCSSLSTLSFVGKTSLQCGCLDGFHLILYTLHLYI